MLRCGVNRGVAMNLRFGWVGVRVGAGQLIEVLADECSTSGWRGKRRSSDMAR